MLGGASRKGLPSDPPGPAQQLLSAPEQQQTTRGGALGGPSDAAPAMRCTLESEGSEAKTELTGLAGSEWNCSFGSDAASLLGSMEFEGSLLMGAEQGSCYQPLSRCGSAGAAAGAVAEEELEARFGRLVRVVGPGESFGERALLSRKWVRAATVIAGDPALMAMQPADGSACGGTVGDDGQEEADKEDEVPLTPQSPTAATFLWPPVELLRIGRSTFDAAVRSLQLAALEELLSALSACKPFSGLARDQLTALAVFCRPAAAETGAVVACQGQPVAGLTVITDGEVQLLDGPAPVGSAAAQRGSGGPGAVMGPPAERRRATADALPSFGTASSSRALLRNLSLQPAGAGRRRTGGDVAAGQPGAGGILTVLGQGALIGENVLGEDAEAVS